MRFREKNSQAATVEPGWKMVSLYPEVVTRIDMNLQNHLRLNQNLKPPAGTLQVDF